MEGHDERESGSGRRRGRRKSGEAAHLDWNIRGQGGLGLERWGLQEEEGAAAARNSKKSKNKSQERWKKRTRRTTGGKRGEKEKKERRTSKWNIRGAEALDWNVQGRSGPGLERPGQPKEDENATERSGEETMNEEEEQMRKATKNKSRDAGGEGEEGEAA